LQYLEEKQDKHNNLMERVVVVEQSTKSAHKRMDGCVGQMEALLMEVRELKEHRERMEGHRR
jgi:SPX domain protein involved in polyphosphate accumulation